MKIVLSFLLLSILGLATSTQADTANKTSVDTDRLLASYITSWSTVDSAQRLALLKTIWADNGVHESPYGRSQGIAAIHQEIEGFIKMFPGTKVTLENIRRTGNHLVCTFVVANPDGSVAMTGTDYFEVDDTGKLTTVVGFVAK